MAYDLVVLHKSTFSILLYTAHTMNMGIVVSRFGKRAKRGRITIYSRIVRETVYPSADSYWKARRCAQREGVGY